MRAAGCPRPTEVLEVTAMSEQEALNKLALGRGYVLKRAEYIASTLLELTPVVVNAPGVTMGVTRGLVLYVNGDWLLSDPEMADDAAVGAVLYHECEHPLRGMDRLDALPNKEMANVAGDEAINDNLRDEGWQLPSWVIYPEKFDHPKGLTLEQYYGLHAQQLDKSQQSMQQMMDEKMSGAPSDQKRAGEGGGPSNGNKGDKKGSSGGKAGDDKGGKSGSGGQGDGQGEPKEGGSGGSGGWQKKVGAGACGGAGGNSVVEQLEAELDAQYGRGEVEVDAIRRATLEQIEEHMQQYGRGSVPGRFEELLKTRIKKPDVDWRKELKHLLRHSADVIVSGSMDYSMRRPSIGGALMGVVSAGLVEREVIVCVAEDTSMSMGSKQLTQARNEGYHLLKKLGLQWAWHIQADTKVQKVQKIKLRQFPAVNFSGRGGTDFRPVFEEIKKLRPRPNLLVYYTDGDGVAPPKAPPGMAVVWCIVRTDRARRPANWGKVVVCDKNQALLPVVC